MPFLLKYLYGILLPIYLCAKEDNEKNIPVSLAVINEQSICGSAFLIKKTY